MNRKFIFSIAVASLLIVGCSRESKDEAKEVANTTIDKVADATNATAKKANDVIEEVKKEVTPIVNEVVEEVKKETAPIVDGVVETSKEVAKSASEMTQSVQKTIHEATAPTVDGKALYARCGSCHGQNGEKKALNASAVIKGWSKAKALAALKGYKDGTYGGAMKGVMAGQVKSFNDSELEALASHISSL